MRLRNVPRLVPVVFCIALLAACVPELRPSDDGDYAWARKVVPTLLGRQPMGEAEVTLVADLAAHIGRQQTAAALMTSPEFSVHWSDLLVDLVRAPREGEKDLSTCIGTPLRKGASTSELANWVNENDPTNVAPPGGPFNLADLLASSIAADNLSPFMRGYLFAFASKPMAGNEVSEQNKRDDFYHSFETVFLGRNSTCLTCHNAAWSKTDARNSGWNRTFAPLGYFERSLLGAHSGPADPKRVTALFRTQGVIQDPFNIEGTGSKPAWGMTDCGAFQRPVTDDPELAATEEAFLAGNQGRRSSLFTVEHLLRSGMADLADGVDRSVSKEDVKACLICGSCPAGAKEPELSEDQKAREEAVRGLFRAKTCFACHSTGMGGLRMRDDATWKDQLVRVVSVRAPKARVDPGHPDVSFLLDALNPDANIGAPFPMPPGGGGLKPEERAVVDAWVAGMPAAAGCSTCAANSQGLACPAPVAEVSGKESLAFLVALNLTDNIWAHVMGRRLTIAHTYSRNAEQNLLLWYLTEGQFIGNGWSLKKLLAFIVASDYYNRQPPVEGDGIPKPSGGTSPYDMPMVFDPWVAQDPRVPPATAPGYNPADHPERHGNAMSEAVERKSPMALLRSVAKGLDWPEPERTFSAIYPGRELAVSLGQFLRDSVPGFRGENFSALVEWEASIATCRKPEEVKIDWIDRAEAAIRTHNGANPRDPVTVIQAAELVKDWLLADGRMSVDERKLVARLIGGNEHDPATLVPALNDGLRNYCGVLLESAQFKLAGVTTAGAGVQPKLRVCNAGPCTYQDRCSQLVQLAGLDQIQCKDRSIELVQQPAVAAGPGGPQRAASGTPVRLAPGEIQELVARIARDAPTNPMKFRVPFDADQLRTAQVQGAKGVAILRTDALDILKPGASIPPDATILSEQGAELLLSVGQASVPVQLAPSQLAPGTIARISLQLDLLPTDLRVRLIREAREGKPLAEMAQPELAVSPVPQGVVDSTLTSAFPYGSAGEPIRPEKRSLPFDAGPLQKRIEAINRMRR